MTKGHCSVSLSIGIILNFLAFRKEEQGWPGESPVTQAGDSLLIVNRGDSDKLAGTIFRSTVDRNKATSAKLAPGMCAKSKPCVAASSTTLSRDTSTPCGLLGPEMAQSRDPFKFKFPDFPVIESETNVACLKPRAGFIFGTCLYRRFTSVLLCEYGLGVPAHWH